ncbi:MAG: type II toxin-antitoxin system VapC family toxin [Pseudomonadota bacterium]|nr:type II toxin-antitoxin system VapC family toxin [Pseudomonadota bacterium]
MIHVIDSSVLIAISKGEPGAEAAMELLLTNDCVISSVNLAEVGTKLLDFGLPTQELARGLAQFSLDVIDFDENQATACAALRASTREFGLSLGDRACLALARGMQATAVTADRVWADLDEAVIGVRVQLIR